MLRWLKRLFQAEPTNDEVLDALDDISTDLAELQAREKAFELEMWELVDGRLTPLAKRAGQRLKRAEQAEIKDDGGLKRTGLITRQELLRRKHGAFE